MTPSPSDSRLLPRAAFRTTEWTMVLAAGRRGSAEGEAALERLCQQYWFPVYAFARRSGYSHADGADLAQGFFARLIERNFLAGIEREKGRFRSFLLTSLKNFMINEWVTANRQKRGGGRIIVSLDDSTADELYRSEPAASASPDKLYEKRWALSVIERALARLRSEFLASERADLFDVLKPALTEDKLEKSYAEIAAEFGLSEGALKMAIHRMRKRFGRLMREEIAGTVENPAEIEDEMRHLIRVLGA
jgi:RNA polymerase sigma factor (sigma-70 family)